MKFTTKKILISFLLIFTLFGCKDSYLDTQPSSSIGEETATSNINNFDYILNGIHSYNYTEWFSQGYTGEHSLNIVRDLMGEDAINSTTGNGWYISESRWIAHRNERTDLSYVPWRFYYRMILNTNGILSKIDNPDLSGEQAMKDRIKAEALTIRAWSHFQLVQLYGKRYEGGKNNDQLGVIIQDKVDTISKPRNTVEDVYKFINDDLDKALTLFKNSSLQSKNRANIITANGIKARVALTQQKWADAAKYAEEAISLGSKQGIKLQSGSALLSGFNDMNTNSEWIWAYKQTDDQNKYFGSFFAYFSWNFSSSNIRSNPKLINKNLYESMSETDIRRNWWDPTIVVNKKVTDSPDFAKAYPRPSNFSRVPYNNFKFTAQDLGISNGDMLLMRVAEMYYIAAEAYAHLGNNSQAQELLNTIMKTRDAKYVKSTNTGAALLTEILNNRRIDLWGEGFRFTDLKRLNLPLDRTTAGNTVSSVSVEMKVDAGDKKWQFLIPKSEIDSNKKMVQNEL